MTRRRHLTYIITHTHAHTHTHTHTPCPLSTESVHWKRPDLCQTLGSTTCKRSPEEAPWSISVSYYCWWCSRCCACAGRCSTIQVVSCTDCTSSSSITLWLLECHGITNNRFFFWWDFFFVVTVKKKEGSRWNPYGNRKQELKHIETAPVSQCFRNTFPKHSRKPHRWDRLLSQLRWGCVFLERTRILNGIQFTTHFIEFICCRNETIRR